MTHSPTAPQRSAQKSHPPIREARDKTEQVQQQLEVASAELHLTNTALEKHLPENAGHGDVERALAQNVVIEGKVQEAADDLETVTHLLARETAERERLEDELAAANARRPH